ncbi:MAG: DUF134 domain-containing protein [Candidatus Nanoarchaeia archaeon]|nr:DUF134 domain-containing protein [Candidatus Nanoarchaeia archaeon]
MVRPFKRRRIVFEPNAVYYKPAGIPISELKEVELKMDELEALRLADAEGLKQEECAEKMGVSQPTFNRIISSARNKVAESLTKGFAIKIIKQ